MAPKTETTDAEAIYQHFSALPYEEQAALSIRLQELVKASAQEQLAEMEKRMADIRKAAGLPEASAPANAGERRAASPRGEAKIAYYNPATGDHSTGRGSWKKAPWVQKYIAEGGDIEKLRVSADNPLPPELA